MVLRAGNEADVYGWKKFASSESSTNPYLSITYNRKPNPAATPTVANSGTYGGVPYAWQPKPTVSSVATDPDASAVSMTTEVHSTMTSPGAGTLKARCATAFVASGAAGSCQLDTALADNTTFYARTAVVDERGLWNGT